MKIDTEVIVFGSHNLKVSDAQLLILFNAVEKYMTYPDYTKADHDTKSVIEDIRDSLCHSVEKMQSIVLDSK